MALTRYHVYETLLTRMSQNRLFQPFSQENPLQTGTGLGLAIVHSIGLSLGGKLDVYSAEGTGTEIRLTMQVDCIGKEEERTIASPAGSITVSMIGFNQDHNGVHLLKETMVSYLVDRWAFGVTENDDITAGDVLFINEDFRIINDLTASSQFGRPIVLLTSKRGDPHVMGATTEFERLGGWCRLVFKPSGPVRLEDAFRAAVARMEVFGRSPPSSVNYSSISSGTTLAPSSHPTSIGGSPRASPMASIPRDQPLLPTQPPSSPSARRHSEKHDPKQRPTLGTRSSTSSYYSTNEYEVISPLTEIVPEAGANEVARPTPSMVTIAENGSVILQSVIGSTRPERKLVVLLVDDNVINRNLLAHWLKRRVRASTPA